ncbi:MULTISPECIES: hypothetical protein [Alphaproteobacteria]|uniref:hypothetical protein n=1 Tax=Alphaproteobacteria TaxID=28211 RepID=UPI002622AB2E|nr:hypothetical protein [Nitratireductor sp.]MCV0349024.1 hypothetical protein [Nitratireductor sp.]
MTHSLSRKLSSCLAMVLYQLENAEESQVNSDFAISMMESVGAELQGLDGNDLAEFITAIREMARTERNGARKRYIEELPENFGLQGDLA